MGHGKHIAKAFDLPWYVMSAKHTRLNPQDVTFPTMTHMTQNCGMYKVYPIVKTGK
jgi:hypothetical protein